MAVSLNETIAAESNPVRFRDAVSSAGFIDEQAAMDITCMNISDYYKVSTESNFSCCKPHQKSKKS